MLFPFPGFPVGPAAGWCKTLDQVHQLSLSSASYVMTGSYTVAPRDGNPGNVFNVDPDFSLNSLGLPNSGLAYLQKRGRDMVEIAHSFDKPIYLSVAGFTPEEYRILAHLGFECGFDGVELNLGCPNVADGGKRKSIASFDLTVVDEILYSVGPPPEESILLAKVSPMTNPNDIADLADLIRYYPVFAVVTMNTLPNCLDFDSAGRTVIQTPDATGWAGGAGKFLLPIALGQISQWRKALPANIRVWGVGGVQSGDAVRKMLYAGASVVQVATALFLFGPRIFSDIASEYLDLEPLENICA
jgi:dihydroorotate dehydrogenase